MNTFTPYLQDSSTERATLSISDEDQKKILLGQSDWFAVVTDLKSGIRYKVAAAACGLKCYCAARIVGIETKPSLSMTVRVTSE